MKVKISKLRTLLKEEFESSLSYQERWPWIKHFPDSKNEEGMSHPGSWSEPTMNDFVAAMQRMSHDEVEQRANKAFESIGADRYRWNSKQRSHTPVDWRRSKKVKQQMFDTWVDEKSDEHRDAKNRYFAPARRKDSEAREKAMQDPYTRKMLDLRLDRDRAEALGQAWLPSAKDVDLEA